MAVWIIPTGNDPFYSQTTTLEGVTYLLTFTYNERCDCWYLSVDTEEGEPIYDGIKLVCQWPLLQKCADTRLPPGELLCWSNSPGDTSPAKLNDLADGGRCQLMYIDSSDMP